MRLLQRFWGVHSLFASAAWLALVSSAIPSRASDASRDLAEKLQESKKGLVEAESQKRKILGSLYGIQQRMKKISRDKGRLTDELFQVQDNVKSIARLIANLEGQITEQRAHLKKRLRALYKLSGESYVGIVFSQSSLYDLDETLRYLKIVTDADYQLIRNYQENIRVYLVQRKKLRGQIERLVSIEKNIKRQEEMLASEQSAKSKFVAEIDRERTAKLSQLKSLRSQTKALADNSKIDGANWDELTKPSIFEQKGQLPAPMKGRLAQDFGLVTDEKFKIRLSHKGWRVEAAQGTVVSAIYDGSVVHSDWINGYGQTVIIDHGDHYYSVYAHIARARVKSGDNLKQGDALGEAGAIGAASGIYFEIRHFSEPENPTNWISKNELKNGSIAQLSNGPAKLTTD